ncbi:restriction endonuclease subunit S [Erysipelothrix larvae]|uniref:restriction endonuclease subunit S n=1 Tax=Erysipelothrix larvae TaxID=1514105 RepID=UPI00098F65EF|nr:restriction endonuclease subunit S [Erysipelothrix larvae]
MESFESNNKIPKVRFKGFTDDWEQGKLEELASFTKGNGYSKADLVDEGFPIILYGRLYTKYETVIDTVDTFIADNNNSTLSLGNEVIVPASGESAEDIARASYVLKKGITLGGDLNVIRPNSILNPIFLALSISNGSQKKEMMRRAQGKSVVHLHNSDLKEIQLMYPGIIEQTQIGKFFHSLDYLITLHQRELSAVSNFKKTMLSKMFPKEGMKQPEVRFDGFTDDWEQCKLSDLAEVSIGEFVIKSKQNPDSPYPVYNGGISYTGFYEDYNNESDKIVISARGANAGYVNLVRKRYWAGNSCYSVEIMKKCEIDLDYLYQFTKHKQHLFTDYQQSANIPSVSKKDVEVFNISTTSFAEQQQIGSFFKQLDDLITLHQRELEQLQIVKKTLLKLMFV